MIGEVFIFSKDNGEQWDKFRFILVELFRDRLATDEDPADHPRGEKGWTFAYGEEPEFDRIIRFNNPVAPRQFADDVGVKVITVTSDGNSRGCAHRKVG